MKNKKKMQKKKKRKKKCKKHYVHLYTLDGKLSIFSNSLRNNFMKEKSQKESAWRPLPQEFVFSKNIFTFARFEWEQVKLLFLSQILQH